ncbi:hypothetical protein B0J13DRAFT_521079 [Dactylonectria estremocensis]|uniref:Uncharacterized protein n=1 Tax=Dactylonectria estremocensis TaxID=1079267 RepID=A0A9P9J8T8_9HYPO|nr:hypothetical protein B0J13DRAFT_521079 [Dactylonectria estremocensis]
MSALDNIAVRALSQLPGAGSLVPLLTGEVTNRESSIVWPSCTLQLPDFRGAVVSNANHQPNSPEPVEIESPAFQPQNNYNVALNTTLSLNAKSNSTFTMPTIPYRPSLLNTFLDRHFPRRSNTYGEILELGAVFSGHLRALHDIFRTESTSAETERRIVAVLEANIREWIMSRQEVDELTKLRFLEFKLRQRLSDMSHNFEAPPTTF